MVENVIYEGKTMAIIVRPDFTKEGIHFFTPDSETMQLAYMKHLKGKTIQPHVHNPIKREIFYTKEVLVIKKGILKVDFYANDQQYLQSSILKEGDIVLLSEGGHGFEVLDDVEMFEIKQGPYSGDKDKTRFEPIKQ